MLLALFLALFVVGGLGSLVTMADPTRARFFPVMMAMLFSSLGVIVLLFGVYSLGSLIGPRAGDTIVLLGIPVGAVGGALLGFTIGSRRNSRLMIKLAQEENEDRHRG